MCVCVRVYVCMCVYMYAYIRIHMYIYVTIDPWCMPILCRATTSTASRRSTSDGGWPSSDVYICYR